MVWFDFSPSRVVAIALPGVSLPRPVFWRGQGPFQCPDEQWPEIERHGCFQRLTDAEAEKIETNNLRAYYLTLGVAGRVEVGRMADALDNPNDAGAIPRAERIRLATKTYRDQHPTEAP